MRSKVGFQFAGRAVRGEICVDDQPPPWSNLGVFGVALLGCPRRLSIGVFAGTVTMHYRALVSLARDRAANLGKA